MRSSGEGWRKGVGPREDGCRTNDEISFVDAYRCREKTAIIGRNTLPLPFASVSQVRERVLTAMEPFLTNAPLQKSRFCTRKLGAMTAVSHVFTSQMTFLDAWMMNSRRVQGLLPDVMSHRGLTRSDQRAPSSSQLCKIASSLNLQYSIISSHMYNLSLFPLLILSSFHCAGGHHSSYRCRHHHRSAKSIHRWWLHVIQC